MKKIMQGIGTLLIVFAIADFGLSYMGINLTPFFPDGLSRFSPIIFIGSNRPSNNVLLSFFVLSKTISNLPSQVFFFKNPRILGILNINCANILSQYMTWLIFFELFSIKYFVTSMIFGENISNYLQSKYSNSTNFVYFSTSGNLLKKKIYPTKTEFIQYSFARFDNFFGNKTVVH